MSEVHKINGLIWLLSHVTFKTKLKVVGSKFHFNKYPSHDICYDIQTYFENLPETCQSLHQRKNLCLRHSLMQKLIEIK